MTIWASGIFLITFTESANSDIQGPKTQCRVPSTLAHHQNLGKCIDNALNLAPPIYIHYLPSTSIQTSAGRLTEPILCAAQLLNIKRRRFETVQAHP